MFCLISLCVCVCVCVHTTWCEVWSDTLRWAESRYWETFQWCSSPPHLLKILQPTSDTQVTHIHMYANVYFPSNLIPPSTTVTPSPFLISVLSSSSFCTLLWQICNHVMCNSESHFHSSTAHLQFALQFHFQFSFIYIAPNHSTSHLMTLYI